MKYDKKIKSNIKEIKNRCESYLKYVDNFNECASSDRMIESIIKYSKELEDLHFKRFNNLNKEQINVDIEEEMNR